MEKEGEDDIGIIICRRSTDIGKIRIGEYRTKKNKDAPFLVDEDDDRLEENMSFVCFVTILKINP